MFSELTVSTSNLDQNSKNFQLSFSVPPNKPIIRDGNGKKMAKTLGPYKIGDKLFATCSTTGGKLWNILNIDIMVFQKIIFHVNFKVS